MCNKKNYKLNKIMHEDLKQYLYEVNEIPLLTPTEERELFLLYKETKNAAIREKIIKSNLRLVVSIAQEFVDKATKYTLDILDTIQYGNEGLMRAVEKFDVDMKYKFSTYATYWIKMYIEKGLNGFSRTIRIPSYIVNDYERIKKFKEKQIKITGIEPSIREIAESLELKENSVKYICDVMNKDIISLYEPLKDMEDLMVLDTISDNEELVENKIINECDYNIINEKLKKILTKKQYNVISLKYGFTNDVNSCPDFLNLVQIGKNNGITSEAVRQTEERALKKLKKYKNI